MLLILPVTLYCLFLYERKHLETADALCRSVLVSQVFVLIVNNLLSIFHVLNGTSVFLSYLLFFVCILILYGHRYGSRPEFLFFLKKKERTGEKEPVSSRILCGVLIAFMAGLSLVLLYGAIFTVPYNYDSMTYHLARIGHWIDFESVNHYVCNIDRQIYSPVLAEYNLLHILLLSGNDSFANFLQYAAMLITAYFVYQTARKLGATKLFSYFGAFVFLFMPLTISQAITTQNDLFGAMFFVLFLYELLDVIYLPNITLEKTQAAQIMRLGIWVGLAYLAKTSICASMLFFMPWLLTVCLKRKDEVGKLLGSVGIAAGAIVVTIAETLIRTFLSGGRLMMDTASGDISVATKNVSYILVNILKNFSLLITQHLYRPLNGFVYRLAIGLGEKLHVEVNNEAIAFHGFDFLHHMNMGEDMYSHDKTPSAFAAYFAVCAGVLMLILLVQCLYFSKKNKTLPLSERIDIKQPLHILGFEISVWLSFGFIMALLRWQPWGTRLLYPALAMTVIGSTVVFDFYLTKAKRTTAYAVVAVLSLLVFALALPSVSYNLTQANAFVENGCKDRMDYYYFGNHQEGNFRTMLELSKDRGDEDIGVSISGDGYDYPLWLEYHNGYSAAKLRHIIVEFEDTKDGSGSVIAKTGSTSDAPDAILFSQKGDFGPDDELSYGGCTYRCVWASEDRASSYFVRN
ncbi:MAG: glycosyltransferase family 39 protein [Lachnospiraceae bacterium]|nr:glycosyltransferase family 39 protein [Lachnospiraceae bacterium]